MQTIFVFLGLSLGKGSRRDFVIELWVGGNENMNNQVMGAWRGKSTERDYWKEGNISGSGKSVAQGNHPGIYKDDPS